MKTSNKYVLSLKDIDKSKFMLAGGKGANLGELRKIEVMNLSDGFCITTEAYKKITKNNQELNSLLDELTKLQADDRSAIGEISTKIRSLLEALIIPRDTEEEIMDYLTKLGDKDAYAVRSSATAEDLPSASFAGQQDTYLNVIGKEEILKHISKCWASLFTERAVIYRIQNGFDHRKVQIAVIVQKMVFPEVAGILFTADPVNGNRKTISIDASFGLGEALVSGLVNADNYKVNNGRIAERKISAKKLAIYALKDGGTKEEKIELASQNKQALTDEQILELNQIGRTIEEHFGTPQDIEWCLVNDTFYIVQSRPITTLFPVPQANDTENHVYVSVGHQQMMTDPMKPLGLSFYLLMTQATMAIAGGRLFVDITGHLSSRASRKNIIEVLGKSDPLIKDALMTIDERDDFIKLSMEDQVPGHSTSNRIMTWKYTGQFENEPEVASDLIRNIQVAFEELKQNIKAKSGDGLLDFISNHIQLLKKEMYIPKSIDVIMVGMHASSWINEKMFEWLGEKNVADALSQSVSNNITSEMGLELLDVADVIRPYPNVVEYLQNTSEQNFLDTLSDFNGGKESREAINTFLNKYGMRGAGEIDITRPRWREKPLTLIPAILNNIRNFKSGESKRKFEQGLEEAMQKEKEILERLRQLPDGEEKVWETKRMIKQMRNLIAYREYPKYDMVNRFYVYKQALKKEAEKLLQAKIIDNIEDIYYLTFEELREVVLTHKLDYGIINKRKEDYKLSEKLNPPRVITSDGEIIFGKYKHEDLPEEAIAGLAVSSGTIEGRARVILSMADANIEEGDILVTTFTDPSWTPLFVSIKGLVTEVGGLMTHGAVIAREYGLPAVVGVENATKLIKDGQRIRVNGTEGYVEIL